MDRESEAAAETKEATPISIWARELETGRKPKPNQRSARGILFSPLLSLTCSQAVCFTSSSSSSFSQIRSAAKQKRRKEGGRVCSNEAQENYYGSTTEGEQSEVLAASNPNSFGRSAQTKVPNQKRKKEREEEGRLLLSSPLLFPFRVCCKSHNSN